MRKQNDKNLRKGCNESLSLKIYSQVKNYLCIKIFKFIPFSTISQ
jgi:hypothetical protein